MNEIDKQLIRKARQLAKKECANFMDGFCVEYDKPCFLINPRYDSIHDGAINCDRFLEAVLPLEKDLNKAIWSEIHREEDIDAPEMKKCSLCGNLFLPSSNRQKYCRDCRQKAEHAKGRERQRRYEDKKRLASDGFDLSKGL